MANCAVRLRQARCLCVQLCRPHGSITTGTTLFLATRSVLGLVTALCTDALAQVQRWLPRPRNDSVRAPVMSTKVKFCGLLIKLKKKSTSSRRQGQCSPWLKCEWVRKEFHSRSSESLKANLLDKLRQLRQDPRQSARPVDQSAP